MVQQETKKYRNEATKRLLIDILKSVSGVTILLSRPAGSLYYPEYFFKDGNFDRTKFKRTVRHAQNYGYIDVKESRGEMTLTLKEAGHAKALKYSIDDIHIADQLIWDKKWRMVIFDVPEQMRLARNIFKAKLDEMGFAQVQKSAYVYPFPCHNEIEFIRSLYGISQFVQLAVIEKLEGDEVLRKRFNI